MGQCCSSESHPKKQNKDIDDRKMFKAAVELMGKEFSVGINIIPKVHQNNARAQPEKNQTETQVHGTRGVKVGGVWGGVTPSQL